MALNTENLNNWIDTITNAVGTVGGVVSSFVNTANQNKQNNQQETISTKPAVVSASSSFSPLLLFIPLGLVALFFIAKR